METEDIDTHVTYRCRKCRVHLDVSDAVIKPLTECSSSQLQETIIDLDTDNCPGWILDTITETGWRRGKINCLKCSGRLGSFDFLKARSCKKNDAGHHDSAVHLLRNRVDAVNSRFTGVTSRTTNCIERLPICSQSTCASISVGSLEGHTKHVYQPIQGMLDTSSVKPSQLVTGPKQPTCDRTTQEPSNVRNVQRKFETCRGDTLSRLVNMATVCDKNSTICDLNKSSTSDKLPYEEKSFNKDHLHLSDLKGEEISIKSLYEPSIRGTRSRKHSRVKAQLGRQSGDTDNAIDQSTMEDVLSTLDISLDGAVAAEVLQNRFIALPNEDVSLGVDKKSTESDLIGGSYCQHVGSSQFMNQLGEALTTRKRIGSEQRKEIKNSMSTSADLISLTPELAEVPLDLSCPVCLELLYSPYKCQPCDHVFCEICLRKMASHQPNLTCCPLCRKVIHTCVQDIDLCHSLKSQYPRQYKKRKLEARKMKMKYFPLPKCSRRENTTRNIRHLVYDMIFWNRFVNYYSIFVLMFSSLTMLISLLFIGKLIVNTVLSFF